VLHGCHNFAGSIRTAEKADDLVVSFPFPSDIGTRFEFVSNLLNTYGSTSSKSEPIDREKRKRGNYRRDHYSKGGLKAGSHTVLSNCNVWAPVTLDPPQMTARLRGSSDLTTVV
jgi:hypothetical protein